MSSLDLAPSILSSKCNDPPKDLRDHPKSSTSTNSNTHSGRRFGSFFTDLDRETLHVLGQSETKVAARILNKSVPRVYQARHRIKKKIGKAVGTVAEADYFVSSYPRLERLLHGGTFPKVSQVWTENGLGTNQEKVNLENLNNVKKSKSEIPAVAPPRGIEPNLLVNPEPNPYNLVVGLFQLLVAISIRLNK